MQKENLKIFAGYNRWMNEKVFTASAALDQNALEQDRGAFFGSILGTLNHLLVGDIVWLKRFAQSPHRFPSLAAVDAMEVPASLDAILYPDLESLRGTRQELDAAIIAFCEEVSCDQLEEALSYKNFAGESYSDPLVLLVQHLFNHQTHHRGQLTTLLSQANCDVGATDLMVFVREL